MWPRCGEEIECDSEAVVREGGREGGREEDVDVGGGEGIEWKELERGVE